MRSLQEFHSWVLWILQVHCKATREFQVIDTIYQDDLFFLKILGNIFEFFLINEFTCAKSSNVFITYQF